MRVTSAEFFLGGGGEEGGTAVTVCVIFIDAV